MKCRVMSDGLYIHSGVVEKIIGVEILLLQNRWYKH